MSILLMLLLRICAYIAALLLAVYLFETVAFGGSSLSVTNFLDSLVSSIWSLPLTIFRFVTCLLIKLVDVVIAVVWDLALLDQFTTAPSASSLFSGC